MPSLPLFCTAHPSSCNPSLRGGTILHQKYRSVWRSPRDTAGETTNFVVLAFLSPTSNSPACGGPSCRGGLALPSHLPVWEAATRTPSGQAVPLLPGGERGKRQDAKACLRCFCVWGGVGGFYSSSNLEVPSTLPRSQMGSSSVRFTPQHGKMVLVLR